MMSSIVSEIRARRTAILRQHSPARISRSKLLILRGAAESQEGTLQRRSTPRHNLVTSDQESSLAPSWGHPTHHEAQNKEVLHGDDQTAQRALAGPG